MLRQVLRHETLLWTLAWTLHETPHGHRDMTPAARDAAAIGVLDRWRMGEPAEAALTRWARGARYAGSSDRAAVRDLVFSAIRRARSAAALGGGDDGRALVLGLARMEGRDLDTWTGADHTPPPPSAAEQDRMAAPMPAEGALPRAVALDMPDWLLPALDDSLGARADQVLDRLRHRASVFLRVHAGRATPGDVQRQLAAEGVAARPHPLSPRALEVTEGARRLRQTAPWAKGLIELQDAASQAVVDAFAADLPAGARVLDFCAGGGGKALALAALGFRVSAHDADPGRMRDLPTRAARAGDRIDQVARPGGDWSAILADAPCSGSGSWRRAPEGKWNLTPERLAQLNAIQGEILAACAARLAPGGCLGYATCSLLRAENEDRVEGFLAAHPDWRLGLSRRWTPLDGGDGFYLAILRHA